MEISWTRGEKCDILALEVKAIVPAGVKTRKMVGRKPEDLTKAGKLRQQEIFEDREKWKKTEQEERASGKAKIKDGKSKAKSKGNVGGEGKNPARGAATRSEQNYKGPDHPTRLSRTQRSGKAVPAINHGTIDERHYTTESITHRIDPGAETQGTANNVVQDTDNSRGSLPSPLETNGRSEEDFSKTRDNTSKDLLPILQKSSIHYYFPAKEKTGTTITSIIDSVEALSPISTDVGRPTPRKRKRVLSKEEEGMEIRGGKKSRTVKSTMKMVQ